MISIPELEVLESRMTKDWTFVPPVAPVGSVDVYSSSCEESVLEWVSEDGVTNDASGVCAMRNSFKDVLAVLHAALEMQEADQEFTYYGSGSDFHRDTLARRKAVLFDTLREFCL